MGDQNIRVGGDFVPDTPQLQASGEIEGGIGEPRLPGAPVELDAHQVEGLVLQVGTLSQQGFDLFDALRSIARNIKRCGFLFKYYTSQI